MKNKNYRKVLIITIIGLFIFTTIHPVGAILKTIQENRNQIKTVEISTYNTKTTNLYCIINNQTNVQYTTVFLHKFIMDKNQKLGIYKDITIKGNAEILELFYPLLGKLNIIPNWLFTFNNKNVTMEIKLLLHGSIHEYTNPDSFELSGRAIGVTLTIEE